MLWADGENMLLPKLLTTISGILVLFLTGLLLLSCTSRPTYLEIPIPDRHTNMLGVEALFLQYLEKHPQDWPKLIRILTEADDALQSHRFLTRAGIMRWINRQVKKERFDEREMPGLFFLHSVYLRGWDRGYLNFVDQEERELLQDLITGVMGALHKCQTCTVSHQ
jgi:hypothetical protein